MKKTSNNPETLLARQAMDRAATKVLQQAVDDREPIPIWDGEKTVWKIPYEEVKLMNARNVEAARP